MAKKRKSPTRAKARHKSGNTTIVVATKQKKSVIGVLWKILWITVMCCLVVGLVSWGLNKIGTLFSWWNVETVTVDALEQGIATNTNGGLTYDQIQQQLSDPDSPYCDDQFAQFQIVEYPSYVLFYRAVDVGSGSYVYPNIIFAKTENGLVWDGVAGVTATISTDWWTGGHYWDSLNISLNFSTVAPQDNTFLRDYVAPVVINPLGLPVSFLTSSTSNQVLFSNFSAGFCQYWDSFNPVSKIWYNWTNESNTLLNYVRPYLIENVVAQYFSNWGNGIELLSGVYDTATTTTDANYFTKFNSYFSFLYDQLKTDDHSNNSKLVDSSSYYARFITDYENYPISTIKSLTEYNGEAYYKVYKCRVIADCTYTYISTNSTPTVPAVSKLDDYVIEEPAVVEEQAWLTVKLVNADESNLTGLSMVEYPVTLIIDGRKFVYDDTTDLTNGKVIALDKGDTYTYSIISEALEFSSYSGSVGVLSVSQMMTLNYTYSGLYIDVNLSLTLLNSMPEGFSLASHPITVTLTGTSNQGVFNTVWDINSNLLSTNTITVKRGTYVWTVTSDYVVFNSTSGQITIDNTHKYQSFSCYFPDQLATGQLLFTTSGGGYIFADKAAIVFDNSLQLLFDEFSLSAFDVQVKIFVVDGSNTNLVGNTSFSITQSRYFYDAYSIDNIIPSSDYFIQLIFSSDTTNNIIVSPVFEVINDSNFYFLKFGYEYN